MSLQALKNLSPPRKTKSLDNSNMLLHMLNNDTYTDIRTAYKHPLIPNSTIQVI